MRRARLVCRSRLAICLSPISWGDAATVDSEAARQPRRLVPLAAATTHRAAAAFDATVMWRTWKPLSGTIAGMAVATAATLMTFGHDYLRRERRPRLRRAMLLSSRVWV